MCHRKWRKQSSRLVVAHLSTTRRGSHPIAPYDYRLPPPGHWSRSLSDAASWFNAGPVEHKIAALIKA